ncbi:hypothetical protein N7G274_010168 [Stereocaulon virgatum]|uniref:Ubiquitin-like domain-containing protein n=1 Tax=Stereocaulon virgatum TaxID=373712 RepID=A0ABR3ZWI8_9LECA
MMATFGYSVSDTFAAVAVISKIIQTLNDTRQSRSEYQNLASDLENLKLVFKELERYSTTTDRATTEAEHGHRNAIQGLASKYKANLLSLLDKIQKFDGSLGANAKTGKLKGQKRKLQWAFSFKHEVPSWRGQIAVMIATLHILMSSSSATTQQAMILGTTAKNSEAIPGLLEAGQHRISAEIIECRKPLKTYQEMVRQTSQGAHLGLDCALNTLDSFSQRIASIANLCESTSTKLDLCKVQAERVPVLSPLDESASQMVERSANELVARICQEYGYVTRQMLSFVKIAFENNIKTYRILRQESNKRESQPLGREPSMLLDDNIHLVDALGRPHSLPYQFFKYWPVLQTYLQCRFADVPGKRHVRSQYYDILPQRQLDRAIGPEEWQSYASKKCRFVMSMRMAMVPDGSGQRCPRSGCNFSPGEVIPDTTWVLCPKCELKFRPWTATCTSRGGAEDLQLSSGIKTAFPRDPTTETWFARL